MKQVKFFSQLKKEIQVTEWCLATEGIFIQYILNGNAYTLMANHEQSADLLHKFGMIDEYSVRDGEVTVKFPFAYLGKERIAEMSYEAFALHHDLSQHQAIEFAAHVEESKSIDMWATKWGSIPEMVRKTVGG